MATTPSSGSMDRSMFTLESPSDQKGSRLVGSNSFNPSQHYPRSASRTRGESTDSDSSFGRRRIRFRPVWNCLSCKELDMAQYRFLLLLTLIFNLVMFAAEVARTVYVFTHRDQFDSINDSSHRNIDDKIAILLSIGATVLTFLNSIAILYLILKPFPRLAILVSCIILILEAVYIVQTVLYFKDYAQEVGYLVITIVFLVFQLCSAWLMYRFWEFCFFNYDEGGAGLRNLVADYNSGNLFQQDLEEALNPTHESSRSGDSYNLNIQQASVQSATAAGVIIGAEGTGSAQGSRQSQRSLRAAT